MYKRQVKHLENGYLAKYENATDLADGIEWLFLHEDREAIQKEARRTIPVSYTHLDVYKRQCIPAG